MTKKVILMIMDGWGHGAHPASDAIYQASVPYVKSLYQNILIANSLRVERLLGYRMDRWVIPK